MSATVAEIMEADVPTVGPDDPVQDVIALLRTHDLPGVPVIDGDGRCVGIVTDGDLVLSDEQGDLHLPHYFELFGGVVYLEPLRHFEDRLRKAFASKVRDMMTADPTTIGPDSSVHDAARVIASSRHNRLPVVDDDRRLLGVVTRLDVLEAITKE